MTRWANTNSTPLDNGKNDWRGRSGWIAGEGDEEARVRRLPWVLDDGGWIAILEWSDMEARGWDKGRQGRERGGQP